MKEYHKINSLYKRDKSKKMKFDEYSVPEFDYLKNNIWGFTEKINGTNICVEWTNNQLWFGGKTGLNSSIPAFLINVLIKTFYDKQEVFESEFFNDDVLIVCEGYGKGIQEPDGSKLCPDGQNISIIDININGYWLVYDNCSSIAQNFGIKCVPWIGSGTLEDLHNTVKKGFKSSLGNLIAEGIVAKPIFDLFNRGGERIITKLKYLDFPPEERGIVDL